MEKEFIPYDLALRMKQLGFDEPCFGYFCNDRRDCKLEFVPVKLAKNWNGIESNLDESPIYNGRNKKEVKESLDERNLLFLWTSAPTWKSAFEWFREKYNLNHAVLRMPISILKIQEKNGTNHIKKFSWSVYDETANPTSVGGYLDNYNECELACLEKLLEIIESK